MSSASAKLLVWFLVLLTSAVEWANSDETTMLWRLVNAGDDASVNQIVKMLAFTPFLAELRSEDGRGPLFWSYEYENTKAAAAFLVAGADREATDSNGVTPEGMLDSGMDLHAFNAQVEAHIITVTDEIEKAAIANAAYDQEAFEDYYNDEDDDLDLEDDIIADEL